MTRRADRFDCIRTSAGFTLVEAMLAITLAALAAAALLQGVFSSIQTTEYGLEQTIARGIAEQMADEITGLPYVAAGGDPYATALIAPVAGAVDREADFDESADYNNFNAKPPRGLHGLYLGYGDGKGGYRHVNFRLAIPDFSRWRQAVSVYYVDETDPSARLAAGVTSNLRAIDVRILRDGDNGSKRQLARVRRVISYVPEAPKP